MHALLQPSVQLGTLCLLVLSFDLRPLESGQTFVSRSLLAVGAEGLCVGLERASPYAFSLRVSLWSMFCKAL